MTVPPGGNYSYNGEGSGFTGNQGRGGDNDPQWLGRDVYDYNHVSRSGNWRDAGPMSWTSPDGHVTINIQNAYFNMGRGFSDAPIASSWGGYNPIDNPQYNFQASDPSCRALAAAQMQNFWWNRQEQQQELMASERWAQNGPPQNYWSHGYRHGGVRPYYHGHREGPEFAIAGNQFSTYCPGQPTINIGIGGRHGGFSLFVG